MESEAGLKDGIALFHNFILLHKLQLEASAVPGHLWEILHKKIENQIFDAGNTFSLLKIEYDEEREEHDPLWKVVVSSDKGVSKSDANQIFLIDHAWTYEINTAKHHLRVVPGLLQRMIKLMGITVNDVNEPLEELVDKVFNKMWKYNQTYAVGSISNVEERMPVWYIMDEFGSAIQHADKPSFRTVPFFHVPEQITYTLLFPIQDVAYDEEVTRDYIEGYIRDTKTREALLLPWRPCSFLKECFLPEEPNASYFLEGHMEESLPSYCALEKLVPVAVNKLKVYSEYIYINNYLSHSNFEIVNDEDTADILWYTKHFKQFQQLSESFPYKFINQFPFEHVITVKDLLSIVCRRQSNDTEKYNSDTLETYPCWLPTTYNLVTELPKFVSYYQHREEKGLDNHWICKPYNLARGLDTYITSNINCILRLPFTGPKIAQKYIENPVLFHRPGIGHVKFDIRYVILLKSIIPFKAYAYKNFFLRFANVPFELTDFDNYEKHFTVMNYNDGANLCRMLCSEFIEQFENQFNSRWDETEEKIYCMLQEIFLAATSKDPPGGIAHNPQSRAVYAVDLMLSWRNNQSGKPIMQPKLLEVNWCPDCQRACEYYNDFYNEIFQLLFLTDDVNEAVFKKLY